MTTELIDQLEEVQRDYPDLHVLIGQTRTALKQLQERCDQYDKTIVKIKKITEEWGETDSGGQRLWASDIIEIIGEI